VPEEPGPPSVLLALPQVDFDIGLRAHWRDELALANNVPAGTSLPPHQFGPDKSAPNVVASHYESPYSPSVCIVSLRNDAQRSNSPRSVSLTRTRCARRRLALRPAGAVPVRCRQDFCKKAERQAPGRHRPKAFAIASRAAPALDASPHRLQDGLRRIGRRFGDLVIQAMKFLSDPPEAVPPARKGWPCSHEIRTRFPTLPHHGHLLLT